MIWLGLALVAIVGLALAAPLWLARAPAPAPSGAARDLAVYRDQLRGIEADAAAGRLGAEEAARLRAEVGRRLLEVDRAMRRDTPAPATTTTTATTAVGGPASGPGPTARALALLGLLALMGGAVALYARLGVPDLPDAPRAARLAEAQARYDSRPGQAEAEAAAPAAAPVEAPAEIAQLMTALRTRMDAAPEPRGLRLLADFEARLGDLDAAQAAFRRLLALDGHIPAPEDHIGLAGVMIEAAGGLITPEAEAEITRALALDPGNQQGLFLKGLLLAQTGRPDLSFPLWRQVLERGTPGAPWMEPIRQSIVELAWLAGEPGYTPPAPAALPGPDADAVAAAEEMSEADRAAMIEQMVAGLEDRLAREGGTAEEWARLVQALSVQGRADRAAAILAEARATFAGDAAAQASLAAAARQAGLE